MCGKDLSKPTTFPLLKIHQKPSSFGVDDFPSCSVSLSLSKALWYLLKSFPGDSKMCFKERGTSPACTFGMLSSPSTRPGRGDSGRDRSFLLEDSPQQPPLVLFQNPTNTQSKRRRWRLPWQELIPHGWRSSFQPWSHWRSKHCEMCHPPICAVLAPSGFPPPLTSLAVTPTPFLNPTCH